MEFSNKLLLTLERDIQLLNGVVQEVLDKVTDAQINSWLYPTKTLTADLKIGRFQYKSKEKQYLSYLENIIDRLYAIINLLERYILQIPYLQKGRAQKNILKPNHLSLGAAACLFWKNVMDLNETLTLNYKISQNQTNSILGSKARTSEKHTQTDTGGSTTCDSCSIAVSCIKEIFHQLEQSSYSSYLQIVREDLQKDVFDITQMGCMNRLTTAIAHGLNYLSQVIKDDQKRRIKDNEELKDLHIKYCQALKIMHKSNSSLKQIRQNLREVKFRNIKLIKSLKNLKELHTKDKLKLVKTENKMVVLERSVQENLITVALLSTDNSKIHEELAESLNDVNRVSDEKMLWKDRFSEIYIENRNLTLRIEEMEDEMHLLRNIGIKSEEFMHTLESFNVQMFKKTENLKKLLNNLNLTNKSSADSKIIKNKVSFKITGDPVADMEKQVQINTSQIKMLEKSNTDLLKTINSVKNKNC